MTGATPRQLDYLRAIVELTERKGYPPTVQEIRERIGVSAQWVMSSLERKGLIDRALSRGRALRVTESGFEVLGICKGPRVVAVRAAALCACGASFFGASCPMCTVKEASCQ